MGRDRDRRCETRAGPGAARSVRLPIARRDPSGLLEAGFRARKRSPSGTRTATPSQIDRSSGLKSSPNFPTVAGAAPELDRLPNSPTRTTPTRRLVWFSIHHGRERDNRGRHLKVRGPHAFSSQSVRERPPVVQSGRRRPSQATRAAFFRLAPEHAQTSALSWTLRYFQPCAADRCP